MPQAVRLVSKRSILTVALSLFLMTLVSACNFPGTGASPTTTPQSGTTPGQQQPGATLVANSDVPDVEIRSPLDRSEVVVNTAIQVFVSAVDKQGVTRLELRADNLLVDTSASPDQLGSKNLNALLSWTPTTAGPHVLQVVAFRATVRGNPKTITLIVRDNAAQVTQPAAQATQAAISTQLQASATLDVFCKAAPKVDGLNFRSGPSVTYPVISTLRLLEAYPVTGRNDDGSWYQLNVNGQFGWASAQFLTLQGVCSTIFEVAAPPSPTPIPGATQIFIPPTFTAIPPPLFVPTPTIRVVVLPTLTHTPNPGPNPIDLTVTAVSATQTKLAQQPPTQGIPPTAALPTLTPVPQLPNLAILGAGTVENIVVLNLNTPGTSAPFFVNIINQGNGPAAVTRISATLPNGQTTNALTPGVLAPGQQVSVALNVVFTQVGEQRIIVVVDADNQVVEADKTDNSFAVSVNVILATPQAGAPTITPTLTFTPPPPTVAPSSTVPPPPPTLTQPPTLTPVQPTLTLPPPIPTQLPLTQPPTLTPIPPPATLTPAPPASQTPIPAPPSLTPVPAVTTTPIPPPTLTQQPTVTPAPPTNTPGPVPPTLTPVPGATNTPLPPPPSLTPIPPVSSTSTKTNTPVPVPPTLTLVPATNTRTNTPPAVPATLTPVPPTSTKTNTPPAVPPTLTPVPPTSTKTNTPLPVPPTLTSVPPTSTKTNTPLPVPPTQTPIPPSATPLPPPTLTPVPQIPKIEILSVDTQGPTIQGNFTAQGAIIPVTITVTNNGNAPAKPFTLTIQANNAAPTVQNIAAALQPGQIVPIATNVVVAAPGKVLIKVTLTFTDGQAPLSVQQEITVTAPPTPIPPTPIPPTPIPPTPIPPTPIPPTPIPPTPIPPTPIPPPTLTPVPKIAKIDIVSVNTPPEPIQADFGSGGAVVPITIIVANSGNAPSQPFTVAIQAGPNPPTVQTFGNPVQPGQQAQIASNVIVQGPGQYNLVVTLTFPNGQAPAVAQKLITVAAPPTPIPPTRVPPTPIPPTPVPPTPIPVVPPTLTPIPPQPVQPTAPPPQPGGNDLLNTPTVPNLGSQPNVVNAIRALHRQGRGNGIKNNEVAFLGDSGLLGIRGLNWGAIQPKNPALDNVRDFFAGTFPNGLGVSTIADQPAQFVAVSLLDPGKGTGACQGKAPIGCAVEARVSVVFIMVGRDDIALNQPVQEFRKNLDEAVTFALSGQVIPVLATIPGLLNPAEEAKLNEFNAVIVDVARTRNVPLLNLYGALNRDQTPPRIVNGISTSGGENPGSNFTNAGLQFGVNAINKAIVDMLAELRQEVLGRE